MKSIFDIVKNKRIEVTEVTVFRDDYETIQNRKREATRLCRTLRKGWKRPFRAMVYFLSGPEIGVPKSSWSDVFLSSRGNAAIRAGRVKAGR
jgi:hypothetical protein